MKTHGMDASDMVTLQWSGDLTIRRIAGLKAQLEEALATATHINIEIAADAESDMTVLQLLCAAHRTATRQEKSLQLCGEIPEQFQMVLKLAGFSRHIGCARDKTGCCMWKMVYPQLDEQTSAHGAATN